MIGYMQSNWAKLEPEREDGDNRGDFWQDWREDCMTLSFTQSSFKKILMPTRSMDKTWAARI